MRFIDLNEDQQQRFANDLLERMGWHPVPSNNDMYVAGYYVGLINSPYIAKGYERELTDAWQQGHADGLGDRQTLEVDINGLA